MLSLSLSPLTGEKVYDLLKEYYLTHIAINSAAGLRCQLYTSNMVAAAKEYAKQNQLVFEHSKLAEFCSSLANDARERFNENHTFKQVKSFYKIPFSDLSKNEIPEFMRV